MSAMTISVTGSCATSTSLHMQRRSTGCVMAALQLPAEATYRVSPSQGLGAQHDGVLRPNMSCVSQELPQTGAGSKAGTGSTHHAIKHCIGHVCGLCPARQRPSSVIRQCEGAILHLGQ